MIDFKTKQINISGKDEDFSTLIDKFKKIKKDCKIISTKLTYNGVINIQTKNNHGGKSSMQADKIDKLSTQVSSLSTQVTSISTQVSSLTTQVSSLTTQVSSLTTQVSKISTVVNKLFGDFVSFVELENQRWAKQEKFNLNVENTFKQVFKELASINKRIDNIVVKNNLAE